MDQEKTGYFIVSPKSEELKQCLALKLKEYEKRIVGKGNIWEKMHPNLAHLIYEGYRDACYKAYILKAVLESDQPIDTGKLSQEMSIKWKNAFSPEEFKEVCGIIDTYCGNRPDELLRGGTGLSELPKPEG